MCDHEVSHVRLSQRGSHCIHSGTEKIISSLELSVLICRVLLKKKQYHRIVRYMLCVYSSAILTLNIAIILMITKSYIVLMFPLW
jgi:hypothetical protein